MSNEMSWTVDGAESLPIHGNTQLPDGAPRGVAVVVHGFTGSKDRNIVPVVAQIFREAGLIAHRFTMGHAGYERDADEITRLDDFERDSLAFCVEDVQRVFEAVDAEAILGRGLPVVLCGHSRSGATIFRVAAEAKRQAWGLGPDALVSLAPIATYARYDEDVQRQLEERGYVERPVGRAKGGKVRLGRSWYEHVACEGEDPIEDDLRLVDRPTLIVHGEADDSVPPAESERLFAALCAAGGVHPPAQRVLVPGADHNFNALGYRPGKEIAQNPAVRALDDAVRKFLDRVLPR